MFLESTRFISRGKGVALTTPLPSSPPASSMVRLPKHPARNPATSGQLVGCGEQRERGLHQDSPKRKMSTSRSYSETLGRTPATHRGKLQLISATGIRHRGSCLLLWGHSHPPRQQGLSSSTPATSPCASLYDSPPKSHPPVTHTFPLFLKLRQPLILPASAHSFSSAEISFLDSSPKELLRILQDTRQECPFP